MNIPSHPKKTFPIAQKISEILRYLKQERLVSVVGGRIIQTPNGKGIVIDRETKTVSAKQSCPLEPVLKKVEDNYYIWIRSGFSGNTIPDFDGNPVGPDNLQSITTSTKLWLRIEWEPTSQYDEDLELHWMIEGGEHISSEFILSATAPTDVPGDIDPNDGTATNAVHHILWADIPVVSGTPSISSNRCGNHYPTYCPGSLTITFEAREIYYF